MDDVINVSGHRLGTAEIEAAIGHHPRVAECAVVGKPHEVKGESVFAFVVLKDDEGMADEVELIKEINQVIMIILETGLILKFTSAGQWRGNPESRKRYLGFLLAQGGLLPKGIPAPLVGKSYAKSLEAVSGYS